MTFIMPSRFWSLSKNPFFSGKFLDVSKTRTTTYLLWQPSPPGLAFYGSGLACLPSWLGMVNAIRNFFGDEICCPTKLPFYLGSLLHIISSLFSHFRSWDYQEHFGIFSQLNRKSKTWFFILPKVCFLKRTGENPNLTAFTSKIQIFLKTEWTKSMPHEKEFWQFSNAKMRFLNN